MKKYKCGNKYPVKITETLEKVVYVEAESKDEAWGIAMENFELVTVVVNGIERDDVIQALREISQCDMDFSGQNGDEYLWAEADGFDSNMEYLLYKVRDIPNDSDMIREFLKKWLYGISIYKFDIIYEGGRVKYIALCVYFKG